MQSYIGKTIPIYIGASIVAMVVGATSATGNIALVAIASGLILAMSVVSSKASLFWFIVLGGLVITGAAQLYLPGSRYIRYIVPLASIVLLLHGVMEGIRSNKTKVARRLPNIVIWGTLFILVATFSQIVNWEGAGVAIEGLKGYFQMWFFFFSLIIIKWERKTLNTIPKALLSIALLQLPFVLHQYFFLVPKRISFEDGIVPVDVVAGTFGASLYGGGANAVLAAFLLLIIGCLVGSWKYGSLSGKTTLTFSILLLSPVFVNEAKVSVIYLIIVFAVLFYDDIIRRPSRFLVAGIVVTAVLVGLLLAITVAQRANEVDSISDLFKYNVERQTAGMDERSSEHGQLTRWTTLTFWLEENKSKNPGYLLIGHGPGASRVQGKGMNLGNTLAEKKYGGLNIGSTGVSAILWDTGLLGMICVLAMFFSSIGMAGSIKRYYMEQDPKAAGFFAGLQAGVVIMLLSMFHKDYFAYHLPYQTLLYMLFGILTVYYLQIGNNVQNGGANKKENSIENV